jgi:hypothetical protein
MTEPSSTVLRCHDLPPTAWTRLFAPWGVAVVEVPPGEPIPGSFWGDEEAGIVGRTVYLRPDTPVHSVLHEGGHLICALAAGRGGFDTDACSGDLEENAVCYLQILLADRLPEVGRERLMDDMDAWGYSFRLGSTRAWFVGDAEDAVDWLRRHRLLDPRGVLAAGLGAVTAAERPF